MRSTDVEYDAGDAASVKEKEKRAKAREERRLNGLRQIMDSPDGRLWMWQFLTDCGMFSTAFNGNSRDYFNLGKRDAGMPILALIQQRFLDQYILMAKENSNAPV